MQLLLDTNGLILKKRNGCFWVIHKKMGRRLISPHRISSIAVVRDCLISTAAMRLAVQHQIPVYFLQTNGKTVARLHAAAYGSLATIRRKQVLAERTEFAALAVKSWIRLKLDAQKKVIDMMKKSASNKENTRRAKETFSHSHIRLNQLPNQLNSEMRQLIMGIEGIASTQYWSAVSSALPENWQFDKRSRRPAQDPFNCILNYGYGMLYNILDNAIWSAGLDPYLGYLHTDGYQRPTLIFDMIEPFRPWIDQLMISDCAKHATPLSIRFILKNNGYWLNKAGRQYYIPLVNDWMQQRIRWQNQMLSRENHIRRFCTQFAQNLLENDHLSDQL